MAKGGARPGAGRKKVVPENHGAPVKKDADEIINGLGKPNPHGPDCVCFKCLWRADAERRDKLGYEARKYLWDRRDGKTVDTVNHLHDKPIDVNLTVSLAEEIQKARKRASRKA